MSEITNLENCKTIEDLKYLAKYKLSNSYFSYIATGSHDEQTLNNNEKVFSEYSIIPRNLFISKVDLSTNIFGLDFDLPFGISPSAFQKMTCARGELDTAEVSKEFNCNMTLSFGSTSSMKDVINNGKNLYMQIGIMPNRKKLLKFMKDCENFGFKALVFTIDTSTPITRETSMRADFIIPKDLHMKVIQEYFEIEQIQNLKLEETIKLLADLTTSWNDVSELKKVSKIPVIVKGITAVEDAKEALRSNVDAIWVSNHGGRQLDCMRGSFHSLIEIAKIVKPTKTKIFFDGGVRTRSDIFKALCVGADYVYIGRPALWGLSCGGADGLRKTLQVLKEELESACKYCGVSEISQLSLDFIKEKEFPSL